MGCHAPLFPTPYRLPPTAYLSPPPAAPGHRAHPRSRPAGPGDHKGSSFRRRTLQGPSFRRKPESMFGLQLCSSAVVVASPQHCHKVPQHGPIREGVRPVSLGASRKTKAGPGYCS